MPGQSLLPVLYGLWFISFILHAYHAYHCFPWRSCDTYRVCSLLSSPLTTFATFWLLLSALGKHGIVQLSLCIGWLRIELHVCMQTCTCTHTLYVCSTPTSTLCFQHYISLLTSLPKSHIRTCTILTHTLPHSNSPTPSPLPQPHHPSVCTPPHTPPTHPPSHLHTHTQSYPTPPCHTHTILPLLLHTSSGKVWCLDIIYIVGIIVS